jgi:hypothetical protein
MFYDGQHLIPAGEEEAETLRNGYTRGELVEIDVKKPRHLKHHRLHFARFREIVKLGSTLYGHRFYNEDALRAFVYVCVGWCDQYQIGPATVPMPRTINWSSVDETVFTKVDQQIVLFLAEELEPEILAITQEADELIARGVKREELRDAA